MFPLPCDFICYFYLKLVVLILKNFNQTLALFRFNGQNIKPVGEITHVFGSDRKVSVAVKFPSIGQKVLEPRSTGLRKISKV